MVIAVAPAVVLAVVLLGVLSGGNGGGSHPCTGPTCRARTLQRVRPGALLARLRGPRKRGDFDVVAVDGDTLVVGAPGRGPGDAYVYVGSGRHWQEQAEIRGPLSSPHDQFGASVAISGTTVVIGAPGQDHGSGAAFVYARSKGLWTERAEIRAFGATRPSTSAFGSWVAVGAGGGVIVVSATTSPRAAHDRPEWAYVFQQSHRRWRPSAVLTAPNSAGLRPLSVAVSGRTIVLGGRGAAQIFSRTGSKWRLAEVLRPRSRPRLFGAFVSIRGRTLAVGAPPSPSGTGRVFVYSKHHRQWRRTAILRGARSATRGDFGLVAISRDLAVVSAEHARPDGRVFLFERTTSGAWRRAGSLNLSGLSRHDLAGTSVALGSTVIVVGSGHAHGVGEVEIFDR